MLRVIVAACLVAGLIMAVVAACWFTALIGLYLGLATAAYPPLIWFDRVLTVTIIYAIIKLWRL